MCGIAGVINKKVNLIQLNRAVNSLRDRGPDGSGKYQDSDVTLIHTRLSIVDLSEQSRQPMISSCGRYTIVFNGEIYNYKDLKLKIMNSYLFKTNSDTEVLLAYYSKYKEKMLDLIEGMFAFAIWDKQEKKLFLARDRFGVKPLYIAKLKDAFIFASKPSTIFLLNPTFKKKICNQALRYYIESGFIPSPFSFYDGIFKLEPGYYANISNNKFIKKQYWSLDEVKIKKNCDSNKFNTQFESYFIRSVEKRLVGDVNFGCLLSGGIDSSLLGIFISKVKKTLTRLYTISISDTSYDELKFAKIAKSKISNSKHVVQEFKSTDILDLLVKYNKEFDEPFFDYSSFPFMKICQKASVHSKSLLSGDGADELFGGYSYYKFMLYIKITHSIPLAIRKFIARCFGFVRNDKLRMILNLFITKNAADAFSFMRKCQKNYDFFISDDLKKNTKSFSELFVKRAKKFQKNLDYPEIAMRLDVAYTLPDDYLFKVDRSSMAYSLEIREPYLDHHMAEWMASLPSKFKVKKNRTKVGLKNFALNFFDASFVYRAKQGFSIPMAKWLRSDLRNFGDKLMRNESAMIALGLKPNKIRELWEIFLDKKDSNASIWSILALINFYSYNFQGENQ